MTKERLSELQKKILLGMVKFYLIRKDYYSNPKNTRGMKMFTELDNHYYVSKLCRQSLKLKTRTQIQSVHRSLYNLSKKGYFGRNIIEFIQSTGFGLFFSERAINMLNDIYYQKCGEKMFIKKKIKRKVENYLLNKSVSINSLNSLM